MKPKNSAKTKNSVKLKSSENVSSSESDCSSDEAENQVAKPKHMLKPPKFDGQTSFETFWAQFTNCAEHNQWTRPQKLAYLQSSFDKEAANVLWAYGKEVMDSLSSLTETLQMRLGGATFTDKHRIELRNRRRKPEEILRSLHSDIQRLATFLLPAVEHQSREIMACDYFVDALADPGLPLKIREKQPVDLDLALQLAVGVLGWRHGDFARQPKTKKPNTEESKRSRSRRQLPWKHCRKKSRSNCASWPNWRTRCYVQQVTRDIGRRKQTDRISTTSQAVRISTTGHKVQDIGHRKLTDRIGTINCKVQEVVGGADQLHTKFRSVQLPQQTKGHL